MAGSGFRILENSGIGISAIPRLIIPLPTRNPKSPHPFHIQLSKNPSILSIQFALPERGSVKLELFNTRGERIALLLDETRDAGHYSEMFDASQLASDVSFQLRTGSFMTTKKMLLLK